MNAGYLLKLGKLDTKDKDLFTVLVKGLKGSAAGAMRQGGAEGGFLDADLADRLRDAYETISKLEHKNQLLLRHLEAMKATYEFFDYSNDQNVLQYRSRDSY